MPEKHPLYDKYGSANEKQNIPAIHLSPAVEHAAEKARQSGQNMPNEPGPKIEAWMSELEGYLEQIKSSEESYEGFKNLAHKAYITGTDDGSVMKKIEMDAKRYQDEGRAMADDILRQVNSEMVEKYREQIRADQQESLDKWIDYLSSDGAKYPMWFKYYTFRNVVKLSDKVINNKFQDRSPGTFNKFPKVNYEALALVFETMASHYGLSRTEDTKPDTQLDSDTKKHLRGDANFAKLYKQAIDVVKLRTKETLNTTEGEWIKYDMVGGYNDYGDDYDAEEISEQAYDLSYSTGGTGWCIGDSPGMAQSYLEGGDFYVYYSKDSSGEYTIPRLAIGMNGTGESAKFTPEIRGVLDGTDGDQGVEPEFLDILKTKMHEINPEDAKSYDKKIENMQRLTDIYARFKDNQELTKEDLVFVYQIEDDIKSFAQNEYDPRLNEILEYRDFNKDLQFIYGKTEPTEIVQAMLDIGDYWFLAVNVDFFDTLDHNQIAQALIDKGEVYVVAENLDNFQGLDNTTAQALIDKFQGWAVAENLDKFEGLHHNQIAQALIAAGESDAVTRNLDKFQGLDNTTAQALIAAGVGWGVAYNLDKFQGLDLNNEFALKLIESGGGTGVAENLNKFQGLDHNQIAQALIEEGSGYAVAENLNKFQGLDNTTAQALIESRQGSYVARNLDKFEGLRHNQIARALIAAGKGEAVAENLNKFQGLDHNQTARALIAAGESDAVARNLDKFLGLDNTTARALIAAGKGYSVIENLDKFLGLDNTTAQALIDKFQGLDHNQTARALIAAGKGYSVIKNLDKFLGLDNTTAQALIDKFQGWAVAENLDKFQGLDNTTAQALIAAGRGDAVARNLDKFEGLRHNQIAQALIESRQGNNVARNLDNFQGLSEETMEKLRRYL